MFSKPKKHIFSPLTGNIYPLDRSNDPAHRDALLGPGALIMPTIGEVYAPFDGRAEIVFDTCHALGLVSDTGIELLIHVGLDTVKLGGKFFKAHIETGAVFRMGDLLLEFNCDAIKEQGFELETPIIVTNSGAYRAVTLVADGFIEKNQKILEIK